METHQTKFRKLDLVVTPPQSKLLQITFEGKKELLPSAANFIRTISVEKEQQYQLCREDEIHYENCVGLTDIPPNFKTKPKQQRESMDTCSSLYDKYLKSRIADFETDAILIKMTAVSVQEKHVKRYFNTD